MEFLDPDGIALRIVHDAAGPHSFLGVRFGENGERVFYETPLLQPAEADTRLVRIKRTYTSVDGRDRPASIEMASRPHAAADRAEPRPSARRRPVMCSH